MNEAEGDDPSDADSSDRSCMAPGPAQAVRRCRAPARSLVMPYRFEVVKERNRLLEAEVLQLREVLAVALGEQRAAEVVGGPSDTPRTNLVRSSDPADCRVDDTALHASTHPRIHASTHPRITSARWAVIRLKIRFALQMCTVRYVGRFLEEPLAVPWSMVEYLAEALDIVDLSCIKRYTERLMTAYEHAWESRRRGTSEQRLAVRTILIDFVC